MKKQVTKTREGLDSKKETMEFIDSLQGAIYDNYYGYLEDEELLKVFENYTSYLKKRIAKKII